MTSHQLSTINYQLNLVSIMIRLVRAVYRYTDISGLFRSKLRQFHPDLFEIRRSYVTSATLIMKSRWMR